MATNEKSSAVLTDAEIKKVLECCPQDNPNHNCARCAYKPIEGFCFDYLMKDALDFINRFEADKEALIAGQETLQKALAEKNAEIEKQSQNLKVLVSDHRTLQQSFDNLKGLYEAENAKVEKANEKCIYFIKELQKARAETDRATALAAEWKDAAYTYADSIDRVKAEAITYAMEWLQANHYINHSPERRKQFVKEMVGDAE